jgi:hypothetical protein
MGEAEGREFYLIYLTKPRRLPVATIVYLWLPLFTCGYHCLPVGTIVYLWLTSRDLSLVYIIFLLAFLKYFSWI